MNNINSLFNTSPTSWTLLYRLTSKLSIVMLLLILSQILVFAISPPPETVVGIFQLYHSNWLLGLLSFDFLYIINNIILILIFLTIFIRLFFEKPAVSMIALAIGIVGIACYFPSNISFEMLTLSTKYFIAIPADQVHFIAAGEALVAGYTGTSFNVYYILTALSLLIFSFEMLKSPQFKKSIGRWGLASGLLMIIPSSAGLIGVIFSFLSLVPWVVFISLLTKYFFALSKVQDS